MKFPWDEETLTGFWVTQFPAEDTPGTSNYQPATIQVQQWVNGDVVDVAYVNTVEDAEQWVSEQTT